MSNWNNFTEMWCLSRNTYPGLTLREHVLREIGEA